VSDGNQEREYQVGVFEARKRIIKLLTEQEYQAGVRAERERIIELAKKLEHRSMTHSELCTREHYYVEKLIAAIKGENK
jgi:hypothetical protein